MAQYKKTFFNLASGPGERITDPGEIQANELQRLQMQQQQINDQRAAQHQAAARAQQNDALKMVMAQQSMGLDRERMAQQQRQFDTTQAGYGETREQQALMAELDRLGRANAATTRFGREQELAEGARKQGLVDQSGVERRARTLWEQRDEVRRGELTRRDKIDADRRAEKERRDKGKADLKEARRIDAKLVSDRRYDEELKFRKRGVSYRREQAERQRILDEEMRKMGAREGEREREVKILETSRGLANAVRSGDDKEIRQRLQELETLRKIYNLDDAAMRNILAPHLGDIQKEIDPSFWEAPLSTMATWMGKDISRQRTDEENAIAAILDKLGGAR